MIKAAHSQKVNDATFGINLYACGSSGQGNESLKDELNVL